MKRHIGKCKKCKAVTSARLERAQNVRMPTGEWRYSFNTDDGRTLISGKHHNSPIVECPNKCGSIVLEPIKGTFNKDVPCNAKCTSSTGRVCECSCGGKNHGASWS